MKLFFKILLINVGDSKDGSNYIDIIYNVQSTSFLHTSSSNYSSILYFHTTSSYNVKFGVSPKYLGLKTCHNGLCDFHVYKISNKILM